MYFATFVENRPGFFREIDIKLPLLVYTSENDSLLDFLYWSSLRKCVPSKLPARVFFANGVRTLYLFLTQVLLETYPINLKYYLSAGILCIILL